MVLYAYSTISQLKLNNMEIALDLYYYSKRVIWGEIKSTFILNDFSPASQGKIIEYIWFHTNIHGDQHQVEPVAYCLFTLDFWSL